MQKYLIAACSCGYGDAGSCRRVLLAQSAATHKCSVTAKKPDGKSMMLISNDTYKSKPDAMKAMKGMAECKGLSLGQALRDADARS